MIDQHSVVGNDVPMFGAKDSPKVNAKRTTTAIGKGFEVANGGGGRVAARLPLNP